MEMIHRSAGLSERYLETRMLDEQLARIRAHRNNIQRYRRLAATHLSDRERQFVERRLSEEQTALEALTSSSYQVALTARASAEPPASLEAAS
ncbi:hypothetical protein [Bradyrhizobium stylosanthis]|uniref:Uncharacterized protein n=1 Tax=Bradyrhizobium stylosanthis TaxID=1803665 RepID=A0A560E2R4_9BRAD|nr:hypothetical protein [Bradyrhizobium stylosanthis]TWB03600.1 hypothetical protein FBZ96_10272 [Bradyrhizobium stylosanthis]